MGRWDGGPRTAGRRRRPSAARPAPTPTEPEPSTGAAAPRTRRMPALRVTCGSPSGWRAATLQDWAGRSTPIRSWIAIEPVPAAGAARPGDPVRAGRHRNRHGDRVLRAPRRRGAPACGRQVPRCGQSATAPPARSRCCPWSPSARCARRAVGAAARGGAVRPPVGSSATASAEGDRVALWPRAATSSSSLRPSGGYHRWLGIEIADLSLLRASPSVRPSGVAIARHRIGVAGEPAGRPSAPAAP